MNPKILFFTLTFTPTSAFILPSSFVCHVGTATPFTKDIVHIAHSVNFDLMLKGKKGTDESDPRHKLDATKAEDVTVDETKEEEEEEGEVELKPKKSELFQQRKDKARKAVRALIDYGELGYIDTTGRLDAKRPGWLLRNLRAHAMDIKTTGSGRRGITGFIGNLLFEFSQGPKGIESGQEAEQVFRYMLTEAEPTPTEEEALNALRFVISTYGGHSKAMLRLIARAKAEYELEPNHEVFRTAMNTCIRSRRIHLVGHIFDEMVDSFNVKPDVLTCNAKVKAMVSGPDSDVDGALSFIQAMASRFGIVPDLVTYNTIVGGLVQTGETDAALTLVNQMENEQSIKRDIYTLNSLIKGYCREGRYEEAFRLFADAEPIYGVTPDTVTYTTLLDGLVRGRDMAKAMQLLDEMRQRGVKVNIYTVNTILRGLCQMKRFDDTKLLIKKMAVAYGTTPDIVSYNTLMDGLVKDGQLEEAINVFREMSAVGIERDGATLSCLLRGLLDKRQIDEAFSLFRTMESTYGVRPDIVIYTNMVHYLANNKRLEDAFALMEEMADKGVKINHYVLTAVMNGLANEGRMKEALDLFHRSYELYSIEHTTPLYNTIINAFIKNGPRMDLALRYFEEMQQQGISYDLVTLNTMIKGLCIQGRLTRALDLYRSMERAYSLRPDRMTYATLLEALGKNHQLGEAREVLKEMAGAGVELTIDLENLCQLYGIDCWGFDSGYGGNSSLM